MGSSEDEVGGNGVTEVKSRNQLRYHSVHRH